MTSSFRFPISDRGTPLPNEGRLSGRIDHDARDARRAAGCAAFFVRPLRQAPRLEPASPQRTRLLGRSHRSKPGKAKLKRAIDLTREILQVPADYRIGIVPASDTGAVEMALWSLLGPRPVTMLAWESFGEGWVTDVVKELKLKDVTVLKARLRRAARSRQGRSGDRHRVHLERHHLGRARCRMPTGSPPTAAGLTICDATSAAFAQPLDWAKLDVVTFSWQKVLGGEAAHGMLILSPRAVARLESYTPPWPLPKIFRMTKGGKLNEGIFEGETINTPSMLCVEDYLDALDWAKSIGGLAGAARARRRQRQGDRRLGRARRRGSISSPRDPAVRSNTSVCLKVVDPAVTGFPPMRRRRSSKGIAAALEKEGVAYDIDAYRDAPPGLRIWCGATVERADVEALTPWLDWAFAKAKDALAQAA